MNNKNCARLALGTNHKNEKKKTNLRELFLSQCNIFNLNLKNKVLLPP